MVTRETNNQTTSGYIVTGRLHTEVLEEVYGPVSVQVLRDDNLTREILLTDQQNIARTYALTIKNAEWEGNKEIQSVNEEIRAGAAIGKAFKVNGFSICKNIIDVHLVHLPEWLQQAFAHSSKIAKARVTEFLVKKDQLIFNYGLITEVYSPDFRDAMINAQDAAQINLPSAALYDMGLTKQQVWNYVENRVGEPPLVDGSSSHTTVRACGHTAVCQNNLVW